MATRIPATHGTNYTVSRINSQQVLLSRKGNSIPIHKADLLALFDALHQATQGEP